MEGVLYTDSGRKIKDHPVWNEGDFSIVSSDAWRFTVDSSELECAR